MRCGCDGFEGQQFLLPRCCKHKFDVATVLNPHPHGSLRVLAPNKVLNVHVMEMWRSHLNFVEMSRKI